MRDKILIFGNSGAGKSTLAKRLSEDRGLTHLDLDSVSWQSPAVRLPVAESMLLIEQFMADNPAWVIEGCYGYLLEAVSAYCSEMIFLNPDLETCLRHNQHRPWEPHKYPDKSAQDKNLAMLQAWVKGYYQRDDEYSLSYHQKVYAAFAGTKKEIN